MSANVHCPRPGNAGVCEYAILREFEVIVNRSLVVPYAYLAVQQARRGKQSGVAEASKD
jgi:hypothetical protein